MSLISKLVLNQFSRLLRCKLPISFDDHLIKFPIVCCLRDASWEVEPNAFQELLFAYNKCDASACECPKGRHHQQDRG